MMPQAPMNDDEAAPAIEDHFARSPYAAANVRGVVKHYLYARLLSGCAGMLFVVLLARHMEVAAYARFATIAGIVATIGLLSSLGLEKAVTCYLPEGRIQQTGAALAHFVWRMVGWRLAVLVAVTGVVLGAWSHWMDAAALPDGLLALVALLIVATHLFQFLALILQCLVQQTILARVLMVQWGCRLLLLAALLYHAPSLSLLQGLCAMAVPELLGSAVLLLALRRHLQELTAHDPPGAGARAAWPPWRAVRTRMRHNYAYAWLIAAPQPNAMIVLAALLLQAPHVAAYGFFVGVIERLRAYLPLQFMLNLAEPVLMAGYVRDRNFDALCRRGNLLYQANIVVLTLLVAWSCAAGPALTRLLTGEKYVAYAWLLPLLLAQIALGSCNTILQVIVNCTGRSDILARSGSVALAAMAVALAGVVLSGRAASLLLATPLVFEVANTATTIFLLHRAGLRYRWHAPFHLRAVAAGGIAAIVTAQSMAGIGNELAQVAVAAILSACVFALACAVLRIAKREDVLAVRRLLRSRPGPAP